MNAEWVTVTSTGRHAVNLRGWTLTDESRRSYTFDLRLPGRSSVRVHTGVGRDTRHDVYQDRRHYGWDSRDTATLPDNRGHRVDSESWGRGTATAVTAATAEPRRQREATFLPDRLPPGRLTETAYHGSTPVVRRCPCGSQLRGWGLCIGRR
ncbi:lamin tail domain-containing protein [Streptomyces sp. NPDC005794]|uniref:lamin tail domain-containing protein n=1 Tax=Streptomyces sp. NPDC005794 TaxID=3364733 RepID=UPI00367ACF86